MIKKKTDGERHWDNIKPTLVRAFAREGARDFDDDYWLMHSGGIPISPELMEYTHSGIFNPCWGVV